MSSLAQHLLLKAYIASPLWKPLVDHHLEQAIRTYYLCKMRTSIDLDHPSTLNEHIQRLKLYGPSATWTALTDKLELKNRLSAQGFGQYLPQTYGYYQHTADIHLDQLPDRFVLKCTHDCGSTIVVPDKHQLNRSSLRFLDYRVSQPYGYRTVEPHYLAIPPKIIAEEMLGQSLIDYKFWCFDGHAEVCLICTDRHIQSRHAVKQLYSVRPYKPLPEHTTNITQWIEIPQPDQWDEMVALAEQLSRGHAEVRVDLYNVEGRICIGELTFTASSGIIRSLSPYMQRHLGSFIPT